MSNPPPRNVPGAVPWRRGAVPRRAPVRRRNSRRPTQRRVPRAGHGAPACSCWAARSSCWAAPWSPFAITTCAMRGDAARNTAVARAGNSRTESLLVCARQEESDWGFCCSRGCIVLGRRRHADAFFRPRTFCAQSQSWVSAGPVPATGVFSCRSCSPGALACRPALAAAAACQDGEHTGASTRQDTETPMQPPTTLCAHGVIRLQHAHPHRNSTKPQPGPRHPALARDHAAATR
jgi:hypothetical protein